MFLIVVLLQCFEGETICMDISYVFRVGSEIGWWDTNGREYEVMNGS